ncbi:hypothetical protein LTR78_000536 [Recurvomyces mirabilis]|uniref:BZIP domain-containing protein n=1 Tax=Recurvomyces mirabilis TaxID=574656 RepID=A0AAE0WY12_9PEZI|nr:hypothetical protein LTR78_000536 [Recurvomyces mirabilis]KAK5162190.1 hypothetical protein LTS14_000536 [Recurvomyces mirabilis]
MSGSEKGGMATAPPIAASTGLAHTTYGDSAFEPHPEFDFDASEEDLRNMQRSITSLDMFDQNGNPQFQDPDAQSAQDLSAFDFPVGSAAFPPDMSSMDPTNMYANVSRPGTMFTPMNPSAPFPTSNQSEIVSARSGSAVERYGQVTPPDNTSVAFDGQKQQNVGAPATKGAKLNKSERARNAANQRHSKARIEREAKVAKIKAGSEEPSGDSSAEIGDKRDKYREKNRLAAAKCRAKKKESVGGLEVQNREMGRVNRQLKEEERRLRDELSMLRTEALQHAPGAAGCMCGDLHQYNRNKASQVVYGLHGPMISSPLEDMMSNATSPEAFGPMSRHNSMPGPHVHMAGQLLHQERPQSFSGPSGFGFVPMNNVEALSDQQSFANFLHNPADGRAGFS